MKFSRVLVRRLHWVNLPGAILIACLQRTPVLRMMANVDAFLGPSRVVQILRAAFTASSLGAMHSLAGATEYVQTPVNPVRGTVGVPLNVGFTYTGTPSLPASFQFSGTLPDGMAFSPAPRGDTISSARPQIVGAPTRAGDYSVRVQGYSAAGHTNRIQQEIVFEISGPAVSLPIITRQPVSQTVAAGQSVTFSVAASSATTYQWQKGGVNIAGATSAALTITNAQPIDAGSYTVVVANPTGNVPSQSAVLTVTTSGGGTGVAPVVIASPESVHVSVGNTVALAVVASGTPAPGYQWYRNNLPIVGQTDAQLTLSNVTTSNAGNYTVVASNTQGSATSAAGIVTITSGVSSRLSNLSVRTNLASGQLLIVGYKTSSAKNMLIRGIGPRLIDFGLPEVYADPRLELYDGGTMTGENDNWPVNLAQNFADVGAFGLIDGSRDAALFTNTAGSRTVWLKGTGSGVVLVEVYDAGGSTLARLKNVSARNQVGIGDNILIAGFVIDGPVAQTLLVRGVGPRLADLDVPDVLANPKLGIYRGDNKLAENDNWNANLAATFGSVGAFTLIPGSNDAALLITLPPGSYTAQISGVGDTTGVGLVEVYELP